MSVRRALVNGRNAVLSTSGARLLVAWLVPLLCHGSVYAQAFDARAVFGRCADGVVLITTPAGEGTGFFVTRDGWIVTNRHVVATDRWNVSESPLYEPGDVQVMTRASSEPAVTQVEGLADFPGLDLALLKVETPDSVCVVPVLPEGDAAVGEDIVAIGHPAGLDWTQTKGTVSKSDTGRFMQTDVAINPGNSGGPLLNGKGQVVGVATAKMTSMELTGFAVKASVLRAALRASGLPYRTMPVVFVSLSPDERMNVALQQEREALQEDKSALQRERADFNEQRDALNALRVESADLLARADQVRQLKAEADSLLQRVTLREREVAKRERALHERLRTSTHLFPNRANVELLLSGAKCLSSADLPSSYLVSGSVGLLYRFDIDRRSPESENKPANRVGIVYTYTRRVVASSFTVLPDAPHALALVFDLRERLRLGLGLHLNEQWPSAGRTLVLPVALYLARRPVPFSLTAQMVFPFSGSGSYGAVGAAIGFGADFLKI